MRKSLATRLIPVMNPLPVAAGDVLAIDGPNFSGRTNFVRGLAGVEGTPDGSPAVYVGPEVHAAISSLAATTRAEATQGVPWNRSDVGCRILSDIGMDYLFDKNPMLLSGGEQACLAIATAAAFGAKHVAIDCTFEQLAGQLRARLLDHVRNATKDGALFIVDNLFEDFGSHQFNGVVMMRTYDEGPRMNSNWVRHRDFNVLTPENPGRLFVQDLHFRYDNVPVLRGIDCALDPGQIYFLEGPNGAGKTTLAKLLCGILRPDRGTVQIEGRQGTPWEYPGRDVGYHFQNPDLQLFTPSVERELEGNGRGLDRAEVVRILAILFGFTNDVLRSHPHDLPFVTRKRVAIAASLALRRPWIILDEPTLGQDENAVATIVQIVKGLASKGTGVIVISHSRQLKELLGGIGLRVDGGRLCTAP
jgi:energy-coupling factor transport system ATP-binding protein